MPKPTAPTTSQSLWKVTVYPRKAEYNVYAKTYQDAQRQALEAFLGPSATFMDVDSIKCEEIKTKT